MTVEAVNLGWLRARRWLARRELTAPALPAGTRARILDVTPDEYLEDPCSVPSLNATTAHVIIEESPRHAWCQHPRLGGDPASSYGSKAMNDGSLLHTLLLGTGKEIAVIPANDFRTNVAKAARDTAIAEGKVPILEAHYSEKLILSERLRDRCAKLGYVFDGRSELAVEFKDGGGDGVPVLCRTMFDHVHLDDARIFEVKKVESANPRKIAKSFRDFGYDIQFAAQVRALGALRPEFRGRVDLTFLFVEMEPPYEIVPVKPSNEFAEIGFNRWDSAIRTWRECTESGRWPGYCPAGSVVSLEPPPWVAAEELGTWQR